MSKYNISGMNENTYQLLYGSKKSEVNISDKNVKMLMTIDTFTKIFHKKFLDRMIELNKVKKIDINLDNIKYNDDKNMYEYIEGDSSVSFKIFSDQILEAPKGTIKELESDKRKGKCHQRTMEIALSFENSKILTGIIHFGNHKALHSVLLTSDGNIIDWTGNMITDKDTFYKMYDFILINEVDPLNLDDDIKLLSQLDIDSKVYLTFRDELMRDIELNKDVFNSESNKKR